MFDKPRRLASACLVVPIVACSATTAPSCGTPTKAAIALTFFNGVTSAPIDVSTTIVYERAGDDSLGVIRSTTTAAPISVAGRPGTYDLRAITPGYNDWGIEQVSVAADGCEPQTATLKAFLQPKT